MTRRTIFTTLIALFAMALAMLFTGTSKASAQQNLNICFYTVDIAGIPPHCFPINLQTEWSCGGPIKLDNTAFAANGIYTIPLNPGGNPPCPPACLFNWASLLPNIVPTPLNGASTYIINNCCYILTVNLGAAGEIYIRIRPC